MRVAQIRQFDVANGEGVRTSLFVSGCTHNCYNCFNKLYQDFDYGELYLDEHYYQLYEYLNHPNISGLSILGGEPMQSPNDLYSLICRLKEDGYDKNIWIYSGYKYEYIKGRNDMLQLLLECDILVDGLYVEELKDLNLKFRGSSNQRIIDIQESIKYDKIIEYNP